MIGTALILTLSGVIVGTISVVLGGGFFWAIPLWQYFFPELGFGSILGNLKVGSVFRGIASTAATWKLISWRRALTSALPIVLGTVLGVSVVSNLGQHWTLIALLLAILSVEFAPRFANNIKPQYLVVLALLVGAYHGLLGAGGGVILAAFLRLQESSDDCVAVVKMEARFIELILATVAVIAHFIYGNLASNLWFWWAIGSLIGGYLGGYILSKLGEMPSGVQLGALRVSYSLAIVVAAIKLL